MAIVLIRVGGREYELACDDGQEEQLRMLADEVDERMRSLLFAMGSNPGETMSLLLTALTMADELIEKRKENATGRAPAPSPVDEEEKLRHESRMMEMEVAMANTLDEIAQRIEKIAEQIEIR